LEEGKIEKAREGLQGHSCPACSIKRSEEN